MTVQSGALKEDPENLSKYKKLFTQLNLQTSSLYRMERGGGEMKTISGLLAFPYVMY